MTLEERLRNLLQTPHKDHFGRTVMTTPTTRLLEQVIQAFKDEYYLVPKDKRELANAVGEALRKLDE